MKDYKFNWDLYPDGISKILTVLDNSVWDRAYYLETDEGVWYEMYVNEIVKSENPTIAEDFDNKDSASYNLLGFYSLLLDHYEEYSQITFFVPNDEEEFTLDEMTNYFS